MKFLHETSIKKLVEEPNIEIKEENGQKIEIKRTVKTAKPIKIALLKPDRKLFKSAEIFYAKTLSEYLKAGLLPYSLVAKRYANDGGPLTDQERKRLSELRAEARLLEEKFFTKITENDEENKKEKNNILIKITDINTEVSNIQNSYTDIFDSTAEIKTRNDTMEWWMLFLTYIDPDGKGYVPMLGDADYETRIKRLEEIEDNQDPFEIEVIKILGYLISFWFTARSVVTKIDFDSMEKLYIDTITDYKVKEDTDIKITDKTESPSVVPVPLVEPPVAATTTA